MPRQSIGTTFVVAMSILGLAAALQVLAVVWRYADVVKQQIRASATSAQADPTPAPADQTAPAIRPAPPTVDAQQLEQLLTDINRSYRLGDFEGALKLVGEAEALAPGDPQVLLSKAAVLEKLYQPAEAILILEQVLSVAGLPSDSRTAIRKKIDQLAESVGAGAPPATGGGATTRMLPEGAGQEVRGTNGIRPGATLGIVDVRTKDPAPGKKTLGVSVKSLPDAQISGDKVKILAYFYEQTEDGETVLTDSRIDSQWMSPPIDWADNEPEILDLEYTTPEAAGAEPGRKYAGYVVGLYYNGALQDFRSEPAALVRTHPLPFDDPQ